MHCIKGFITRWYTETVYITWHKLLCFFYLQNNGSLNSVSLPLSLASQITTASTSTDASFLSNAASQIASQVSFKKFEAAYIGYSLLLTFVINHLTVYARFSCNKEVLCLCNVVEMEIFNYFCWYGPLPMFLQNNFFKLLN